MCCKQTLRLQPWAFSFERLISDRYSNREFIVGKPPSNPCWHGKMIVKCNWWCQLNWVWTAVFEWCDVLILMFPRLIEMLLCMAYFAVKLMFLYCVLMLICQSTGGMQKLTNACLLESSNMVNEFKLIQSLLMFC